ncbi:hypothetical protein B0H14DRAFT_2854907 [Mycena olivaceomarginata]|nr:hypothetical protein B0H14DRAFT_2854907 [Mycena olivaceomarginata]
MANDKDALLEWDSMLRGVECQWEPNIPPMHPNRSCRGLESHGNRGLQPAMDFLFENEGRRFQISAQCPSLRRVRHGTRWTWMTTEKDAAALQSLGVKVANDVEAKSIKCSECGKVFRNTALAQFHAEKSGHQEFEESTEELKPLTEEEKKQKLAELREKMAAKRATTAVEEAKEAKANRDASAKDRKGRTWARSKKIMEKRQALKDAEQKKKDKIEDAKAKAAIKAQIEADKKARAENAPAAAPAASTSNAPASGVASKDFKETRLQIRNRYGEVAEFLAGQSLAVDPETISFAQHFPRKAFSKSDFSKSLRDLGLTPSAVLIATPPGP